MSVFKLQKIRMFYDKYLTYALPISIYSNETFNSRRKNSYHKHQPLLIVIFLTSFMFLKIFEDHVHLRPSDSIIAIVESVT